MANHSLPVFLIIEDNADDERLLTRVVRDFTDVCRPVFASSIRDALDFIFRRGPYQGRAGGDPRLVLTDLRMPPDSAFHLLEELVESLPKREFPVVVWSGGAGADDIERCYRLGANSFLLKPTDFKLYGDMVATLIRYWLTSNVVPEYPGARSLRGGKPDVL